MKDLQPRITTQIDDLLREIDDLTANIGHTGIDSGRTNFYHNRNSEKQNRFDNYKVNRGFPQRGNNYKRDRWSSKSVKPSPAVRKCKACYSVGEPFIGHTVGNCPNISSNDRAGMLKTFSLDIDENNDEEFLP